MSSADVMLQQAQALIKAGRRADARPMLEQIVNADDQNEQAWLWLSACVESLEEQRICLENVLMLNPGNQKAIKGLETIRQKLGGSTSASKPSAPPAARPAPPPPAPDPYNPYSAAGPDSFGSPYESNQFEQPPADEGWAPATSVDWGRGGGPAYGSGKKINEPTASEFDSWVAKLPLDGKKPQEPPPPQPMPRRGTVDMPPMPVTSTEDQFNIPSSPYNASDDPFRGNFDFNDFGASPAAPTNSNAPVNPFGLASSTVPAASPQSQQDFDFAGFDGPFSSGSSGSNEAYTYDQAPSQPAQQLSTDDGWGDFGTPSFTQSDSGAAFTMPGGFNDATAEDAYEARRNSAATSAERFQFGERRAPTGTQGRRSQLPNIESAEGLFADDDGGHGDFPAPSGMEFADDDALTSSGIFGAAKRSSEAGNSKSDGGKSKSKPAKAAPAPRMPSVGAFKAIPPEIQVKAGGGSGRTVVAIVGLLILNAASIIVLLFVNLRGMGLF